MYAAILPEPVDSIRLAVLTVSPNRQYRGIRRPTTPATHEPVREKSENDQALTWGKPFSQSVYGAPEHGGWCVDVVQFSNTFIYFKINNYIIIN